MTDLELDARTWDGLEYLESVSGPGAIAELIQGFVHDAGPRLDRMNAALAASERESLRGLAHDLKTNAATVGALQLSRLGAWLCSTKGARLARQAIFTASSMWASFQRSDHFCPSRSFMA